MFLLLLFTAYLDRRLMALLVGPVEASLGFGDARMGLLQGPALALAAGLSAWIMGRLLDRYERDRLLLASVLIWTLSVALGGFCQSFWQLFLCRMATGIGSAGLLPTLWFFVANEAPIQQRGRAYAISTIGIPLGTGLSLLLVGAVSPVASALSAKLAAGHVHFEPWRVTFVLALLPGLLCLGALGRSSLPGLPLREWPPTPLCGRNFHGRRFVALHHFAAALATFGAAALTSWLPTALMRQWSLNSSTLGISLGVGITVTGIVGALVGGTVLDLVTPTGGQRACLSVALSCIAIASIGVIGLIFPISPRVTEASGLLALCALSTSLIAFVLALAAPDRPVESARQGGAYFACTGVFGVGAGPAIIGLLADNHRFGPLAIGRILGGTVALVCFFACLSTVLARAIIAEEVKGTAFARLNLTR